MLERREQTTSYSSGGFVTTHWSVVLGGARCEFVRSCGCARKQIIAELPWSANRPSAVLWVPIKVQIRARKPKPLDGDIREVVYAEFDGKPRIWPGENNGQQKQSG